MTDRAELLMLVDDIEAEVDRRFAVIAVKAGGYPAVRADYKRTINDVLSEFGTSDQGVKVTKYQSQMSQAMVEAFQSAFDLGYIETSGDETQTDSDAQGWLNARVESELGFIKEMFQSLKDLRIGFWTDDVKAGDIKEFVAMRAEGYTNSLDVVNATGKLYGKKNQMLTMVGDDGKESCKDCQRLKGKRHSAKWWLANGFPPSRDFECHGYNCQHYLADDEGNRVTL
jgi:hypothetical protein